MIEDVAIPLLTPLWWLGLLSTLAGVGTVLVLGRRLDPAGARRLARILAAVYLAKLVVYHVDAWARDVWFLADSLPLHLCGLSGLLGVA